MIERERLIELLLKSEPIQERDLDDDWGDGEIEEIADYLLANGVIVPPFKVGDWVYILITKKSKGRNYSIFTYIHRSTVTNINFFRFVKDFGKTVFLTKEEAEKALKERSEK